MSSHVLFTSRDVAEDALLGWGIEPGLYALHNMSPCTQPGHNAAREQLGLVVCGPDYQFYHYDLHRDPVLGLFFIGGHVLPQCQSLTNVTTQLCKPIYIKTYKVPLPTPLTAPCPVQRRNIPLDATTSGDFDHVEYEDLAYSASNKHGRSEDDAVRASLPDRDDGFYSSVAWCKAATSASPSADSSAAIKGPAYAVVNKAPMTETDLTTTNISAKHEELLYGFVDKCAEPRLDPLQSSQFPIGPEYMNIQDFKSTHAMMTRHAVVAEKCVTGPAKEYILGFDDDLQDLLQSGFAAGSFSKNTQCDPVERPKLVSPALPSDIPVYVNVPQSVNMNHNLPAPIVPLSSSSPMKAEHGHVSRPLLPIPTTTDPTSQFGPLLANVAGRRKSRPQLPPPTTMKGKEKLQPAQPVTAIELPQTRSVGQLPAAALILNDFVVGGSTLQRVAAEGRTISLPEISRDMANDILMKAATKLQQLLPPVSPDGIFLVRASPRAQALALSVFGGGRVYHYQISVRGFGSSQEFVLNPLSSNLRVFPR